MLKDEKNVEKGEIDYDNSEEVYCPGDVQMVAQETANGMLIESEKTENNFQDGLVVIDGNGNKLLGNKSAWNGRHGIVVTRSRFSGGLTLSYSIVENNGNSDPSPEGHGIWLSENRAYKRQRHLPMHEFLKWIKERRSN